MKTLIATAALAAYANALTLGSGATAEEHAGFISFLASTGTNIDDANEFTFRESMFAAADRWIKRQNEDSLASGYANPVQYGHNQFSTMTLKEKANFLGIKKKLMKWIKRWIERMQDCDDSSDDDNDD